MFFELFGQFSQATPQNILLSILYQIYSVQLSNCKENMTQPSSSKRWVDYTDSDSQDESAPSDPPNSPPPSCIKSAKTPPSPPSKTYRPSKSEINQQLDLLDDLNYIKVDEVWLDIFSQNRHYLEQEMDKLKSKAKKRGNIVEVVSTQDPLAFQVKVFINIAFDYIEKGYDAYDYLRVRVADKNFQQKKHHAENKFEEKGKHEKSGKYIQKHGKKEELLIKKDDKKPRYQLKNESQKFEKGQEEGQKPKVDKELNPKETKEKKSKKPVTSKYASKNPFDGLEGL